MLTISEYAEATRPRRRCRRARLAGALAARLPAVFEASTHVGGAVSVAVYAVAAAAEARLQGGARRG